MGGRRMRIRKLGRVVRRRHGSVDHAAGADGSRVPGEGPPARVEVCEVVGSAALGGAIAAAAARAAALHARASRRAWPDVDWEDAP